MAKSQFFVDSPFFVFLDRRYRYPSPPEELESNPFTYLSLLVLSVVFFCLGTLGRLLYSVSPVLDQTSTNLLPLLPSCSLLLCLKLKPEVIGF